MLIESKTIEVIQSVGRQQDESDSCGMEFVKMDTAIRMIRHLDIGQIRDEFSTLKKVLYKTPDRLVEQYRFREEEGFMMDTSIKSLVEQLMAAVGMKYDEAITMRNMEVINSEEDKDYIKVSFRDIQKSRGLFLEGEGASLIGT